MGAGRVGPGVEITGREITGRWGGTGFAGRMGQDGGVGWRAGWAGWGRVVLRRAGWEGWWAVMSLAENVYTARKDV